MFLLLNLVICLLAAFSGIFIEAENLSGYYVQSPLFNFFLAPKRIISRGDAKHIFIGKESNCTCRNKCFAIGCKSWSLEILRNGVIECRLSEKGPSNVMLEEVLRAIYFFREENICSFSLLGTAASQVNKTLTYPMDVLEDVALRKKTTQSSIYNSTSFGLLNLTLVVDGNDSSYGHTNIETNPWWLVDLGEEKTIFHIIILPRNDTHANRFTDAVLVLGDRESKGLPADQNYRILNIYAGPYSAIFGRLLYTCEGGVKGRYLGLWLNTTQYLHMSSVEVLALKIT